jgi:hypothetical protein
MPIITGVTSSGGGGGGTSGSASDAVVQFVNTISGSPVIRFDFNDLEPAMATKIDLSPPPLRKAKSSTMLNDGELVNASAYDNRTITLTIEMVSDDNDAAAAALSALAAELNRSTNILRVKFGTVSTFFRTYRSSFTTEMLNYSLGYTEHTVTIEAEPFGLGLPVDVAAKQVYSDPANGGRQWDINDVRGDVETPPQITMQPGWNPGGSIVIGVRRHGNPDNVEHWVQAEICSPGFDTSYNSHSAAMSGDGAGATLTNSLHVSFAVHSEMANRVGFLFPPTPTVDGRGTYRLFARVQPSSSGSVGLMATYGGRYLAENSTVLPTGTGFAYLADLGTFTAPRGTDPVVDGYSGAEMAISVDPIWLLANQVGGATMDVDYFYIVPADDHFAAIALSNVDNSTTTVIDGPNDSVYQVLDPTVFPRVLSPSTHTFSGSLPMLSPGSNRLYFLGPVHDPTNASAVDVLTTDVYVSARYWPRYLTLATA